MLPIVKFTFAYASFWASKAQSISKPSKSTMHMLCKCMQVVTKFDMWNNGMSTFLSKILNLLFNIPKALSTNILVLDWIKF